MKIGIIIGSVREGRKGASVAEWVLNQAQGRDASYEIIDLASFGVPILTDPGIPAAAQRKYSNDHVQAWSAAIDACDGFVFVTPEHNHGVPGAMKNAFDSIYPEWNNKAVTFAGYGADGAVRAVEHWRGIVANAHMVATRAQVAASLFTDFDADGAFTPAELRTSALNDCLAQLETLTRAMASVRAAGQ